MFWEIFSQLCREKNIKPNPLGSLLGISSATITGWKNGKIPSGNNLLKIAEFFGVSIEYLLTGKERENMKLSINERELLSLFSLLDEREQLKIIGHLEYIVSQNEEFKSKGAG